MKIGAETGSLPSKIPCSSGNLIRSASSERNRSCYDVLRSERGGAGIRIY